MSRNGRVPRSLNKWLVSVIIASWLIPTIVIVAFMTVSFRKGMLEKTEKLLKDELWTVSSFLSIGLDEAIAIDKKPSYERSIEEAWRMYQGYEDRSQFYRKAQANLRSKFYIDKRFEMFAFYLAGERTPMCYFSRNSEPVSEFAETIKDSIGQIAAADTSDAHVRVVDGRIFIIRNMYTTNTYTKFGTLVVEINQESLFQDIKPGLEHEIIVCINEADEKILLYETEELPGKQEMREELLGMYDPGKNQEIERVSNNAYVGYMIQNRYGDYHIAVAFVVEKNLLYSDLYVLYRLVAVLCLIIVPVLAFVLYFLRKQITIPIDRLTVAARKMEEGQIGTKLEGEPMPNEEFEYLKEAFNQMSVQVKHLFDYAYDETMARKDAKIMALQSQINPHFLNNTLEMMNWQARMSGDVAVSKMIEALGTVMDYRMDRSDERLINLAEELRCADAYFYIISMRFGQRLQVEKEIDEQLLQVKVPRLILQPILENAVVHGVEQVRSGIIKLKIYQEDRILFLQVINSGRPLTEDERERIRLLLSGTQEEIAKGKGRHTSLGIRNVNERIKLIYGDSYGLTIEQMDEGHTVSTIRLPSEEKGQEEKDREVKDRLKNIGKSE